MKDGVLCGVPSEHRFLPARLPSRHRTPPGSTTPVGTGTPSSVIGVGWSRSRGMRWLVPVNPDLLTVGLFGCVLRTGKEGRAMYGQKRNSGGVFSL